jgi:hypothetical protein
MRGDLYGPFVLGLILSLGLGLQVAVRTVGAVPEETAARPAALHERGTQPGAGASGEQGHPLRGQRTLHDDRAKAPDAPRTKEAQ